MANNTTNYLHNVTEEEILEFIRPKIWTWFLICCHVIVFVFGLAGNALVCVAIYRNRSMRTVTNYFIMNLAIADFMVILICLPPTVVWDFTLTWFFGNIACKVVLYLQTVSVTVSVLTLTFISIERWYAICFPLKFKSTTGRAKTAIIIIWVIALLFDIPELIVFHKEEMEGLRIKTIFLIQCKPSWSEATDHAWNWFKMFCLYILPLLVMTFTYCHIVYVLWKPKKKQHELAIADRNEMYTFSIPSNASTRGQLRSRKKAAKMLMSVVIMFAACYLPVHLYNVLRRTLTNSPSNRIFSVVSHWLCYANSAINPLIYNFMSGKFRKEFKRSYDCCGKSRRRTHNELMRLYKIDSSSKGRSLSKQSRITNSSDIKRSGTVTTKISD